MMPENSPYPDQTVLGLKLLGGLDIVINQPKTSGLATAELREWAGSVPSTKSITAVYQSGEVRRSSTAIFLLRL
jgi:hypothetical protein